MSEVKKKKVTPFRLWPETRERLKTVERSMYAVVGRWTKDQDDLLNKLMDIFDEHKARKSTQKPTNESFSDKTVSPIDK